MLGATEAIQPWEGEALSGSWFRSEPELTKSSLKRLWTITGKVVQGQPYEVGWGGEEEDVFLGKEDCKRQEIILPQTMPVLEKEGHKQRWRGQGEKRGIT